MTRQIEELEMKKIVENKKTLFEVIFDRKPILQKYTKEDPRIEAFKKKLFPEELKPVSKEPELI